MRRLLFAIFICLIATAAGAQKLDDGQAAYEKGDYKRAYRFWKPLADKADPSAQYNLALLYANGWGVPRNSTEAVRLYRLAAKAGVAGAQTNLGFMYEHGQGVEQDDEQALSWYTKAAEKGEAYAQNSLGMMYDQGRGVGQDDEIAIGLSQVGGAGTR